MTTLKATKQQTVTLSVDTFADLIAGASVTAATGKNAPERFAAVYLSANDGKLSVSSTDRYRLITGSTAIGEGQELGASMIRLADIKRVVTLIKPYLATKRGAIAHEITLSRVGDILSVSVGQDSAAITLGGDTMPDFSHMITDSFTPLAEFNLNLELLGSFSKVPSNGAKSATKLGFTAENKPVQIIISHDLITWRGLLMPMKVA